MMKLRVLWGVLFVFAIGTLRADELVKSTVNLHAGVVGVVAGQKVPLALKIDVPEGWYTYAADPGDAGMPPSIRVQHPKGMKLSDWRFPPHETIRDAAGTYNGYKQSVVLLNEVLVPDEQAGAFKVTLDVVWMICKDMCLPFRDRVTLDLPLLSEAEMMVPPPEWQALLAAGGWEEEKTGEESPQHKETE